MSRRLELDARCSPVSRVYGCLECALSWNIFGKYITSESEVGSSIYSYKFCSQFQYYYNIQFFSLTHFNFIYLLWQWFLSFSLFNAQRCNCLLLLLLFWFKCSFLIFILFWHFFFRHTHLNRFAIWFFTCAKQKFCYMMMIHMRYAYSETKNEIDRAHITHFT